MFLVEAMLKIAVFGLVFNGPTSYLRNSWNILDFFIIVISVTSLFMGDSNLNTLKVLRLLRVLRPLRMISRNEGLKIAVKCLIRSLPGIINVFILSLIFYFIIGILLTNLFKGSLAKCNFIPYND